jgi:maltokinase
MSDHVQSPVDIDSERLAPWLTEQRWFASKSRSVTGVELIEQLPIADGLVLALVQAGFATGTHEIYQLLLETDGAETRFDGLGRPEHARELLAAIEAATELDTDDGQFVFRLVGEPYGVDETTVVRAMGVEQSNSSVVFDDQLVLKVFRKVDAGINPELELLRFLTARGFANVAPLHGWYEYEGTPLAGTLGVVQEFLPEASEGWQLALDEIPDRPQDFLDRIGGLGTVTAQMHSALASDAGDPAFSPEDPSVEAIGLLTATIDEDIERIFLRLPDDERLAPIVGRGDDARQRLAERAKVGIGGKHIRIHGDYHLGQTMYTPGGWVILDFEGEPARPLSQRRMKRSPLRDVASMLRSFAYATSAVSLLRDREAPGDFEQSCRDRFLERYFADIDPALLPAGESAVQNMLAIFELEKAIYELRYELNNRPDWVSIPVAGIVRLLEAA